jgi:hypothetical protein
MFNPKGNNLLDEQMFVSGLEMGIVITPALALAGVSAGASIFGGIMGASQASSQNAAAKKAQKEQKKFAKETAKLQNKHNDKLDAADKANYYAMREFNHETQLKDWQRGNEIQDYKYLQSLKQFEKSLTIGSQQLDLNSQAEQLAIESEETAIQEAFIQQQFQRRSTFEDLQQTLALESLNRASEFQSLSQGRAELANKLRIGRAEQAETLRLGRAEQANILRLGRAEQANVLAGIQSRKRFGRLSFDTTINGLMAQNNIAKETQMVEGLVRQGATQAVGQAGVSTAKTQQSNLAQMQRGLMGLEAELSGTAKKAALQLAELNSSLAQEEVGVGLNIDRLESSAALNLERLGSTTALNLEQLESTTALDLRKLTDITGFNLQRIDNTIKNSQQEARFNLDVMRENMQSNIAQTQRNIEQIRLNRQVADTNTRAGMMLFPERLSYNPRPELPPERIFVDRMKAIPGYVPPAQQQSVWAPLVSGFANAASSLATIDYGGGE